MATDADQTNVKHIAESTSQSHSATNFKIDTIIRSLLQKLPYMERHCSTFPLRQIASRFRDGNIGNSRFVAHKITTSFFINTFAFCRVREISGSGLDTSRDSVSTMAQTKNDVKKEKKDFFDRGERPRW